MALEQSSKKVYSKATTKSIPLLQPDHEFCLKSGSERGQTQNWYPNEKMVMVPVCLKGICCSSECMVHGYCITLTKIKAMSLCLFRLFEEMLSMEIFWNIQREANYPRAILEFEIFHQTFVLMTQNIVSCNLNACVFRIFTRI